MSLKKTRFTTIKKRVEDERISFIILGAGRGRMTKSYGNKSLAPYRGRTLLQHQVDVIRSKYGGLADIVLVTGYDSENVIRWTSGVRIVENPLFDTTDVTESMRIGLNACLSGCVFFVHGDMVFSPSFLCVPDADSIWLPVDIHDRLSKVSLGVTVCDGIATHISYGLPKKWCQISYFPSGYFKKLKFELSQVNKNESSFGFLNKVMNKNKVKVFEPDLRGFIKEVNSSKDII
jgi:CTP:phosphocholine cytidylyltransferase-like protein